MLEAKLPRAVLYLEPHQVSLYSTVTAAVQSAPFSQGMVSDMEVIAVEILQAQLDTWLKQENIQPHAVVVVVAESLYFKREFPGRQNMPYSSEITAFLEMVPIESPTTRVISMTGAAVAVAVNKDFYQPIIEVLQKQKMSVVSLTPAFVFHDQAEDATWQFNSETARAVISQWDNAQRFSLVPLATKKTTGSNGSGDAAMSEAARVLQYENSKFTPPVESPLIMGVSRQLILAGVFVLLLVVLGVVLFMQSRGAFQGVIYD